jgi:subtilisin family serine protease
VATTAAGTKYGVAKKATIVPVRLLNCAGSGSYSGVIAALDWILSPSNTNSKTNAVLNLSIGGGKSSSVNDAITRLTNAGISVVVAAGNSNQDACNYSPSSAPSAITVGSTMVSDAKSSFSNWGSCVDIFAPGSGITGGWYNSATDINTISGTSMASPHVAGAAAVFRGLNPTATVEQIAAYLDSQATLSAISGLPSGTVNKLLYVSPTDGGPAIVAPAVAFKSIENITHNSAAINLDVNPNNAPTQVSLEYSLDQNLASGVLKALVAPESANGSAAVAAVAKLIDLTPSSTYFFRAIGVNESGQTISSVGSFKTLSPPAVLPVPAISSASNITAYSAT